MNSGKIPFESAKSVNNFLLHINQNIMGGALYEEVSSWILDS